MNNCVRKKTLEDFLQDLVSPDREHDYEKEIIEVLGFIDTEMACIEEKYYRSAKEAQLKAKRLQAILDCVADGFLRKDE